MWNDIGGKIKTLAKVVYYLGYLLTIIIIILGFYVSINNVFRLTTDEALFVSYIIFFIIAIGIYIFVRIISMFLYGYGELIQNTEKQTNLQNQILEYLRFNKIND